MCRVTPLRFDILNLRVEKNGNSEGRDANRALFYAEKANVARWAGVSERVEQVESE